MKLVFPYRARVFQFLFILVFIFGTLRTSRSAGSAINVPAGGDLQAALNAANPGDTILLAAGATYTGSFKLPTKSGSSFITIRTSASDSQLPPAGTRIDPSYFAVLPKILGPAGGPAVYTDTAAHHYQFIGVEIAPTTGTYLYNVVLLGDGTETSTSMLPHDITFDRTYIHGDATAGTRRGIAANGANINVINSYISDLKEAGADSQAISCWNGSGPLFIQNNYLSGAGENILIGGMDPKIQNLVPSNITVTGNYFYKPLSWRGSSWTVKNLFELKNANNVVVDSNVFENNWAAAQNGFAILFTTRDQEGTAPWSVVSNVQFTNNIVRHASSGLNILGLDDLATSAQGHNYTVANNLFLDITSATWGGYGRLFQVLNAALNVTIEHNTGFPDGAVLFADSQPSQGFVFQNNVATQSAYGVIGTNTANALTTLAHYFPGNTFNGNAIVAGNSSTYPSGNYFPATTAAVGFVDYANGNYALSASSPYATAATDGTTIGVNIAALNPQAAILGATFGGSTTTSNTNSTTSGTTNGTTSTDTTTGTSSGSSSGTTSSGTTAASGTSTSSGTSNTSGTASTTRIEDSSSAISYTGGYGWHTTSSSLYSGGTEMGSNDTGAKATLTFSGTGVSFIGYQDEWSGIANIYIDGIKQSQIDTYASPAKARASVYSVTGLSSGSHTITVEGTGTKNSSSGGTWIWVDAFDVTSGDPVMSTTGSGTGTTGSGTATTGSGTGTTGSGTATTTPTSTTSTTTNTATSSGSSSSGSTTSAGSTSSTSPVAVPAPGSNNGSTTPATPVSSPVTASQAPVGGGESLTTSNGGSLQVGSAEIVAPTGQVAPAGLAIFGYRSGGVLVSEAGVPGRTPGLRGRIYVYISGAANTGLALANENDSSATVSFTFTDANGTDFGAGSITLPAHGQIAKFLDQAPFNAPHPTEGSFTYTSDLPVSAIAIRGLTNSRSEFLVTTLPVANPDADGNVSNTVFFPHFATGGGWTTQFILVNPSDRTIGGTLSFFSQGTPGSRAPSLSMNIDGTTTNQITYSIPPRSSKRFSTMNSSGQLTVGTAQVTPALDNAVPVGTAIFSFQNSGITVAEAGTPSMGAGSAFRMYAEADKTNLIVTAIAVENSGSNDTTVHFDLTKLDGTQTGLSGQLVIPSNGQRALFMNQIPGFENLPLPFKGVLRVSSADPTISVLGVRSRWNERGDFIFTTTPASNESAQAPSTLVFPHIVDGGGYSTQFIMYSGTPAEPPSGNLQLFSQSGSSLNLGIH
jgi:hypothetical protein